MPAMDTIAGGVSAGIATRANVAFAGGDSGGVRAFPDGSAAWLEGLSFSAAVLANVGDIRVRSPRFHDNQSGLSLKPGELQTAYSMPAQAAQRLYSADVLDISILGGAAAEFQELALFTYYDQLESINAVLTDWPTIKDNILSHKYFYTVCGAAGANTWSDTVITTTDNQFHADHHYAVLGFDTDTALTAVGVKGAATGNLHCTGPGTTVEFPTSEYFVRMSDKHGKPHIPVFAANDRAAFYVSVVNRVAIAGTEKVTLICVELP